MATHSEKILQYLLEMCQKCLEFHFWTKKKVKGQDSDLKISSPVGQIDRKKRNEKIKLLLEWFANSFRKNPPICAGNVRKLPQMLLFEPREKSHGDLKMCPPLGQIDHKNVKKKWMNYSHIDLASHSEKKLQ